jgi:two-component system LytT family response regulator
MIKITAIIVDDEKGVRELLKLLIQQNCPEVKILAEAGEVDSAYKEIIHHKPDLVFLDIQMPKGDGFSLLKKFDKPPFSVIFTTSYGEYAIWAIKANAVDYLLKPYDIAELKLAVQKVAARKESQGIEKPNSEVYIQVHVNDKVEQLNAKEIVSLEAQNNYTLITTSANQKYLVAKVLSDIHDEVSGLNSFIRIHRSTVINTRFIKNYSKVPPYTIRLNNDQAFEVSRRKRSEILEILKSK